MRRTQIYLDEAQALALAERARVTGRTRSDLIREAIDQYLARPDDAAERLERFRAAVKAAAGIAPYLDDGYLEEARAADREREERLERQWRG